MIPTMEQEKQMKQQSSSSNDISLNKPLRCIVKLGGAAITCKNELEKINDENLKIASSHLRQAMNSSSSSNKVIAMDWSKRSGVSEISASLDDFGDFPLLDSSNSIVVHGAGSFGHFQASRSGVHKGGLHLPLVRAGFVATRISVTSLNLEIVRALAREGIPSIGMSPFACGWSTCERNLASADISQVAKAINSGFVPVLHGDAVLDNLQGCTILSGDVIIRHLAELLKPEYVVFLVSIYAAGLMFYACLCNGLLHKILTNLIRPHILTFNFRRSINNLLYWI
ncbi:isopentenyl phosphate kinase isoform X2 [Telopea speciosissima]|uniref:isopentenyl phosphate kinase isoform X2 n=1 Tax=Telopea speciosissima TaxID=54955 RepID=UPI001CC4477B|nr:isopentenyl phosphate kinase isoform X2 [Telopea speciosissima]